MSAREAHGAAPRGFVHARDGRLVDGAGRELALRGVGLGNWLLAEGYMWRFGEAAQSPRQIEAAFRRVAGDDYAGGFWRRFRSAFITEADIARIAESGFDHVRLPLNARVIQAADGGLDPDGIAWVDACVDWCRTHGLYVLLDLHGAPGGQTGTNIDDSPRGRPDLFASSLHRDRTIALWTALARRYRAHTHVLGYDLLNEPLPYEWHDRHAADLVSLYRDLTRAIRAVDPDHLIMYEGTQWATNWSIFDEVWDHNSALQFHKYWSAPDRASIQPYLDARERLGLPIYMGEGGENTPAWLYTVTRLYEGEGIGWNLWPFKKLETASSPASIVAPEGWWQLVGAIEGRGAIAPGRAREVLDAFLDAVAIGRCEWRPDVLDAVLARSPRSLPAWGYGHRGPGESYSPSSHAGPRESGLRTADAVNLREVGAPREDLFGYAEHPRRHDEPALVVELEPGQWLEFELAGTVDAADWVVHGPAGLVDGASVRATARGIRVYAPRHGRAVEITRVVRRNGSAAREDAA